MQYRKLAVLIAGLAALSISTQLIAEFDYTPPRNSFGQPAIGGVWSNATTTPFERPDRFGKQLVLSEEQAAKVQGAAEAYREAGNKPVVETIDFHPDQTFYGASDELKVTERFTRIADDRLLYQFTVEDPKVWDEPWGGEYEFWASPGFYEYACHEGNMGLEGILAGARQEERQADERKSGKIKQ